MVKWIRITAMLFSIYITGFINPAGSGRAMSLFLPTEKNCMIAVKIKVKCSNWTKNSTKAPGEITEVKEMP